MAAPKKGKSNPDKIVYVKGLKGTTHAVSFTHVSAVHPSLKEYFCYCLLKSSNQSKVEFDRALTPFRFQTIHFAILNVINGENAPSQNQVADRMGIDKASMVKLIDHLESLKIVERVSGEEDRRCKLLHLTTHGKTVFSKAKEAAEKAEKEFMKNLTTEEQKILKKLVPKLLP